MSNPVKAHVEDSNAPENSSVLLGPTKLVVPPAESAEIDLEVGLSLAGSDVITAVADTATESDEAALVLLGTAEAVEAIEAEFAIELASEERTAVETGADVEGASVLGEGFSLDE